MAVEDNLAAAAGVRRGFRGAIEAGQQQQRVVVLQETVPSTILSTATTTTPSATTSNSNSPAGGGGFNTQLVLQLLPLGLLIPLILLFVNVRLERRRFTRRVERYKAQRLREREAWSLAKAGEAEADDACSAIRSLTPAASGPARTVSRSSLRPARVAPEEEAEEAEAAAELQELLLGQQVHAVHSEEEVHAAHDVVSELHPSSSVAEPIEQRAHVGVQAEQSSLLAALGERLGHGFATALSELDTHRSHGASLDAAKILAECCKLELQSMWSTQQCESLLAPLQASVSAYMPVESRTLQVRAGMYQGDAVDVQQLMVQKLNQAGGLDSNEFWHALKLHVQFRKAVALEQSNHLQEQGLRLQFAGLQVQSQGVQLQQEATSHLAESVANQREAIDDKRRHKQEEAASRAVTDLRRMLVDELLFGLALVLAVMTTKAWRGVAPHFTRSMELCIDNSKTPASWLMPGGIRQTQQVLGIAGCMLASYIRLAPALAAGIYSLHQWHQGSLVNAANKPVFTLLLSLWLGYGYAGHVIIGWAGGNDSTWLLAWTAFCIAHGAAMAFAAEWVTCLSPTRASEQHSLWVPVRLRKFLFHAMLAVAIPLAVAEAPFINLRTAL
eukprot:jgi/Chlat1/5100/Chrsp33S05109